MTALGIDTIQMFVAHAFGVEAGDMRSKARDRRRARPRQVAMYLARDLTTRSLPEIGRQFGNRDHTTVLHACRNVTRLMQKDATFAEAVQSVHRSLTVLKPNAQSFNVISLGDWLTLARRVNVPMVPARFITEARIDDLRAVSMGTEIGDDADGARAARLKKFFATIYAVQTTTDVMRWDFCAPEGIKHAMAKGATSSPPPHIITLDEPRVVEILEQLPPTQITAPVWRRPWTLPRIEFGYPVEYRVFVENGKVIGVSNYYPQRVLKRDQLVDYEIKLATIYAEAMIAAQTRPLSNPQIGAAGLDVDLMHCTMDFIATKKQVLFLEGGPPALPQWGAHPCCFEGRAIEGVALGPKPKGIAA